MAFTVSFGEEIGYPKERSTDRGFVADRLLRCRWSDRLTLYSELLDSNNFQYPYRASGTSLLPAYVTAIGIDPDETSRIQDASASLGMAQYEDALLRVRYESVEYDPTSGLLVSETLEPTRSQNVLGAWGLTWDSSGFLLTPDDMPHHDEMGLRYSITFYHATSVPSAYLSLANTCNAGSYASKTLGLTFAAETLLFLPGHVTRQIQASIYPKVTYTLSALYKPSGWNTVWNPLKASGAGVVGGWDVIKRGTSTYKPHPPVSWTI